MARGDALRSALSGAVPTGKVKPMAEEKTEGTEAEGTEGTEGTEAPTPEEIEALREENARLKADADKKRTAAAREAKAKADAERKAARESEDSAEVKKALADAEKRAADAELRANQALARSLAAEAGAKNPAVVVRLINFDALVDASDETEVKDAIEAILKEEPYLKARAAKSDAGEGSKGKGSMSGSTDFNAIIRGRGRG